MSKKRKLKKKFRDRLAEGEQALVFCVRGKCAPRDEVRQVVDTLRGELAARSDAGGVRVEMFGCMGKCKKGPIAATLPKGKIRKHVDVARGRQLIERMVAQSKG